MSCSIPQQWHCDKDYSIRSQRHYSFDNVLLHCRAGRITDNKYGVVQQCGGGGVMLAVAAGCLLTVFCCCPSSPDACAASAYDDRVILAAAAVGFCRGRCCGTHAPAAFACSRHACSCCCGCCTWLLTTCGARHRRGPVLAVPFTACTQPCQVQCCKCLQCDALRLHVTGERMLQPQLQPQPQLQLAPETAGALSQVTKAIVVKLLLQPGISCSFRPVVLHTQTST